MNVVEQLENMAVEGLFIIHDPSQTIVKILSRKKETWDVMPVRNIGGRTRIPTANILNAPIEELRTFAVDDLVNGDSMVCRDEGDEYIEFLVQSGGTYVDENNNVKVTTQLQDKILVMTSIERYPESNISSDKRDKIIDACEKSFDRLADELLGLFDEGSMTATDRANIVGSTVIHAAVVMAERAARSSGLTGEDHKIHILSLITVGLATGVRQMEITDTVPELSKRLFETLEEVKIAEKPNDTRTLH